MCLAPVLQRWQLNLSSAGGLSEGLAVLGAQRCWRLAAASSSLRALEVAERESGASSRPCIHLREEKASDYPPGFLRREAAHLFVPAQQKGLAQETSTLGTKPRETPNLHDLYTYSTMWLKTTKELKCSRGECKTKGRHKTHVLQKVPDECPRF